MWVSIACERLKPWYTFDMTCRAKIVTWPPSLKPPTHVTPPMLHHTSMPPSQALLLFTALRNYVNIWHRTQNWRWCLLATKFATSWLNEELVFDLYGAWCRKSWCRKYDVDSHDVESHDVESHDAESHDASLVFLFPLLLVTWPYVVIIYIPYHICSEYIETCFASCISYSAYSCH